MELKDFYYDLPQELIAQKPLVHRSESRLLILDKNTGERQSRVFKDIVDIIETGSCLVLNDTKVIPARLFGERKDTRGKVEILLLKRIDANRWEIICKPGKKARVGSRFVFADGILEGEICEVLPNANRIICFQYDGVFEHILDRLGEMPLPPYITERLDDKNRYQTVFAKNDGSSAAPTAGLHFTNELLEVLKQKGIKIAKITLHVGLGTFRPVKTEKIEEHEMHSESFIIEKSQADIINDVKRKGGKIIAVGTTSCRALESCVADDGFVQPVARDTDIFIYPGYRFKVVDNLITNFHLPESTLIMLVSALAGYENTMKAYKEAVDERFRFFSFGDAMFIGD